MSSNINEKNCLVKYRWATSFLARVRGLLGSSPTTDVLILAPCKSIHTCGMRYDLDVAFINKEGIVLATYRKIKPWRMVRHAHAVAVIERQSDGSPWFEKHQKVYVSSLKIEGANHERMSYL